MFWILNNSLKYYSCILLAYHGKSCELISVMSMRQMILKPCSTGLTYSLSLFPCIFHLKRIWFPRRWVSCTVLSQHHVSKTCWVWIGLQPPSVFHGLCDLRVKETVSRFGRCWHEEPRVLCSRRRVLAPQAPQGTAQWQHSDARAPACSRHPWYRCGNHHREKTFQKDCL